MGVEFEEENFQSVRRPSVKPKVHLLMKFGLAKNPQQAQAYSIGIIVVCVVVALLFPMLTGPKKDNTAPPAEKDIPNPLVKMRR